MKKIINLALLITTVSFVFAQEIALPEVVTEIQSQDEVAAPEVAPDFSDVFGQPEGSGQIVPVLPEIEIQESKIAVSADPATENKIYAEGQFGGGFPALIGGDFSVYELSPTSPFKLSFTHNSAAGYANNSLTEGFNDSTTSMSFEKSAKVKNFDFNFDGSYEAEKNGLQNKVDNISDLSQNVIDGEAGVCWNLPNNFYLSSDFGLSYYNRFADITGSSEEIPEWAKTFTGFDITPDISFAYKDYGFDVSLGAQYWMDKEYAVSNRGQFSLDFSWQNDVVKPFANSSIVVGNYLNGNSVVVPFTVGINSSIPVNFATNRFCVNAQGGIESERKSIADYEKLYNFTAFSDSVNEVSEWYGRVEFVIPVKSIFSSTVMTEYRQTAFGNGRYVPAYDSETLLPVYGLYGYEQKNIQMLTTDLNFMVNYKIFSMVANWHSNWIDVPALESANMIGLNLALQGKNALWNVSLNSTFFIAQTFETPLLTLKGTYKVTDGVQLIASVDDIVNLVSGGSRTYGGQYISRSGTASFLLKFFF